ncbi:MAG TPA: universal stress protein [Actinoplanes sp.]|jgi:nucleotide-binding universal stress UspA family protein
MNVLAWLAEGTWPAVVDAAAPFDKVTFLHVTDPGPAGSAHGAFAGLLGRGTRHPDPGAAIESAQTAAESRLLTAAASRRGRSAPNITRRGRLEREVVSACQTFDLLIVARDGDLHRVGPRSLAPPTRFVVDHAPCSVLLIWPAAPTETEPPPPPPSDTLAR